MLQLSKEFWIKEPKLQNCDMTIKFANEISAYMEEWERFQEASLATDI